MTPLPDHPDIACALRTGYPPWMLPEVPWSEGEKEEDPERELWFSILSNLELYGNPAGACLYELPPPCHCEPVTDVTGAAIRSPLLPPPGEITKKPIKNATTKGT